MAADNPSLDQAIACHVEGQLDQALLLYLEALRLNPRDRTAAELVSAILRTHFELAVSLTKLGRASAAIKSFQRVLAIQPDEPLAHASLSRLFLARDDRSQATTHLRHYLRLVPEDHIGARLLLAYTGAEPPPDRPPPAYITRFYDSYAETYDHKLVDGLDYRCPQLILAALRKHCRSKLAILDLGCGTGLCGQAVSAMATRLDGVDLSPQMIAKARQRAIYNELTEGDLYPFLEKKAKCYDVLVAAGVFEHIGDPRRVFRAAFGALRGSGLFVFTAEDNPTRELSVNSSGYYMHGRTYLAERAARCGFAVSSLESATLRLDNGAPVRGLCVVLSKTP
jgi:predicted TPR repeat methyltransferase